MRKLTPLVVILILAPVLLVTLKLDHSSALSDLVNSPVFWLPLVVASLATFSLVLMLRFITRYVDSRHHTSQSTTEPFPMRSDAIERRYTQSTHTIHR